MSFEDVFYTYNLPFSHVPCPRARRASCCYDAFIRSKPPVNHLLIPPYRLYLASFICGNAFYQCLLFGVRKLIHKICPAIEQNIPVHPRTPSHHIRMGSLFVSITVVGDIALSLHRPYWAVVMKQRRHRCQAVMIWPSM
jgi:hypothetical protein